MKKTVYDTLKKADKNEKNAKLKNKLFKKINLKLLF